MKMPPNHTLISKSANICIGRVDKVFVVKIGEQDPVACKHRADEETVSWGQMQFCGGE